VIYALAVIGLVFAGRRGDACAFARFVPDCVIFFARLVHDPQVSRRQLALLLAVGGYLAMPFDLVPDFRCRTNRRAVVVMLVLRTLMRSGGPELIYDHWPGPTESRRLLLRLAGVKSAA
jgi:hypothetical protein